MKLTVVSPKQCNVYWISYLEVETSVGSFVILEGHEPLILQLSPGKPIMICQKDTQETFEKIPLRDGGILAITRTEATLLIDE